MELCSLQRQTTEEVSCKIQEWIGRYGLPEVVHSDNGTCFTSRAFEQFCSQHGIRHTKSTTYHPQANGAVERFNRTLGEMLARVIDSNHTTWQSHLTQVQLAYNTSYHESIGDIPYRVIFKEMPRTLLQAAADSVCRVTEHKTTSPMAYVENSLTSVPDIYQKVKKNYSHKSNERQRQYNKSKLHFTPYSVGDLVWITRPSGVKQVSRSFCPRWMGPYKVVKKISDVVYKVRRPYGGSM